MTIITAAVAREQGQPLTVEQLNLDDIRPNEARVRMVASGVCHTDAIVRDGVYPTPLPAVLGHEGAGVVEQVGADVTSVRPGDHVVLSAAYCASCAECQAGRMAYCENLFAQDFGGRRRRRIHRPVGRERLADLLALLRPVVVRQLRQRGRKQLDPGAQVSSAGGPGPARLRIADRFRVHPERAAPASGLLDRRHRRRRGGTGRCHGCAGHRVHHHHRRRPARAATGTRPANSAPPTPSRPQTARWRRLCSRRPAAAE